uniref:Reverse transcriptase domain-containing protein n=1 Tax=Moniliophthora roreri TaxID=221103 RepID=A0A0W0FEE3_MONRR
MFQAFMNDVLSDFIDKGWCVVYMDDILIFLNNLKDHCEQTKRLMKRIQEHNLYLKPEKCKFDVKEVVFLGMVIQSGYAAMDSIKLAGIAEWEAPRTVKGKQTHPNGQPGQYYDNKEQMANGTHVGTY